MNARILLKKIKTFSKKDISQDDLEFISRNFPFKLRVKPEFLLARSPQKQKNFEGRYTPEMAENFQDALTVLLAMGRPNRPNRPLTNVCKLYKLCSDKNVDVIPIHHHWGLITSAKPVLKWKNQYQRYLDRISKFVPNLTIVSLKKIVYNFWNDQPTIPFWEAHLFLGFKIADDNDDHHYFNHGYYQRVDFGYKMTNLIANCVSMTTFKKHSIHLKDLLLAKEKEPFNF